MKFCFFAFLFLYVYVVNAQGTTPSPEEFEVMSISSVPTKLLHISEVDRDSMAHYSKIRVCLNNLAEFNSSRKFGDYVLLCGGIFVTATLENQSCPPATKDKKQMCTSRYRIKYSTCPGLAIAAFSNSDVADKFDKYVIREYGEYLEVNEYQVSSSYWRWDVDIYINNMKDKIRVYSRSCWGENCE